MASKLQNKNAKKMLARHTCPGIGLDIIQKEERKEKKRTEKSPVVQKVGVKWDRKNGDSRKRGGQFPSHSR